MLPKVHDYMASRGLDLRKLHIVPNGIALDDWQRRPAAAARRRGAARWPRRASAGRMVVGYAGSMGLPNALDTLLDAAALLRGVALQFVLVGDGHEKARLARRVADEGLDNVTLLPPMPKAQIPTLLAAIDIAYIGWQRVPIYRFGIAPNKLMDYMMAGVPVLHSVDAGNDPVAEGRLRPDRAARIAGRGGRRAAPAGGAERGRAPRDGRARPRVRARAPQLCGAGAAFHRGGGVSAEREAARRGRALCAPQRRQAATACCVPTSGRRCRSASAPCSACSRRPGCTTCRTCACWRWAAAPAATCWNCCAWASRRTR